MTTPRDAPNRRFIHLAGSALLALAPLSWAPPAIAGGRTTDPQGLERTLSEAASCPTIDPHLRAILLTSASHAAGTAAVAPAASPLGQALPVSEDYSRATPQSELDLIINGDVARADLEALGVSVGTQAGGVTTARAPVALVPAIMGVRGVAELHAAARLEQSLDVSTTEIGAREIWGGTPPTFSGVTGKHVVVGVIDVGFDLSHKDLRTASNLTRVKAVWDQSATGTPPTGFTYGSEYTESQINANLAVTVKDLDGHGTYVASIAAGCGQATGMGQPGYTYVGVAPEADIVLVQCPNLVESRIIDGVNYTFRKAAALGEPAVVNISANVMYGDRDGGSSLDMALSALAGPGKLLSTSVGNNGDQPLHAKITLNAGQTGTIQFQIPNYTPVPAIVATEYLDIQGWHDPSASFAVKVRSPNGYETPWVNPGGSSSWIDNPDGHYEIVNDITTSAKGGRAIAFYMNHTNDVMAHPAPGTWTITLTRTTSATTGLCHLWLTRWALGTTTLSPVFLSGVDQDYSIQSPATADSAIATGAYSTKTSWISSTGTPAHYSVAPPYGTITTFSGRGPRRDGVMRPDVIAPGYGVVGALSTQAAPTTSGYYKMQDMVHYILNGTSAAAAHTTGALALLLQQTPTLTPSAARKLLAALARSDSYTGAVPNTLAGYGKLNVIARSTAVGDALAQHFSFAPPFPNPSSLQTTFAFSLSPADLAGASSRVEIRIVDIQGRTVSTLAGSSTPGPQQLVWNGRGSNGAQARPGVYFAQLHVGAQQSIRRFLRVAS